MSTLNIFQHLAESGNVDWRSYKEDYHSAKDEQDIARVMIQKEKEVSLG